MDTYTSRILISSCCLLRRFVINVLFLKFEKVLSCVISWSANSNSTMNHSFKSFYAGGLHW